MKDIIIVGASGFGRELLQWIKDINRQTPTWNIVGFIDDNRGALDGITCDYSVVGTIRDYEPKENDVFACAISSPGTKEKVVRLIEGRGGKFVTVIHPTTIMSEFVQIGEGTVIAPVSKIGPNVLIGKCVSILSTCVGHDAEIDDFSTFSGSVAINGNVKVGKRVFVGCGSCVYQGKRLGDDCFVGMGSVVYNSIKSGIRVIGNPAKKIDL